MSNTWAKSVLSVDHHALPSWDAKSEVDRRQVEFYSAFLRPGDLCIDVGANVGMKTAILLETGASVVAVEPQSICFDELRSKYSSDTRVRLVNKALGSTSGCSTMLLCTRNGQLSTISEEWRLAFSTWEDPAVCWDATESIDIVTLDWIIGQFGKPKYIKIDVEGYEY